MSSPKNTSPKPVKGRGVPYNPPNRFEPRDVEYDGEWLDEETPVLPRTQFLADTARSIFSHNESPDVGFDTSINPYRGCEHGCVYCYARPTHEYFGLSAGLDFERVIFVKHQAPELLEKEFRKPGYTPRPIALSGNTDPYQPVERQLRLTRRLLEVMSRYRNPVIIVTKNARVTRDLDYLTELARWNAVRVVFSLTTLDADLCGKLEPRTSRPALRLAAISRLAEAGIPVGVLVAPVIPGLTDHEIPAILDAARSAGARFASYIVLRLPYGVKDMFANWLRTHYPDRAEKVLNRIKAMRGGKLYDADFAQRHSGSGPFAHQIKTLFEATARRLGYAEPPALSTEHFHVPGPRQLSLFDLD